MTFIFNWGAFYDYYTSKSNLHTLKTPVELIFYVKNNKYTGEWREIETYSKYFLTFENVNVYVTYNQDGWIFFNVIRVVNGRNLGDHMTIGLKNRVKGLIDMHYTVQNEILQHSEKNICFLKHLMQIDNFEQIYCANPNGKQMKDHFTAEQLNIMEKIISRPFLNNFKRDGGSLSKKHLHLICQQLKLDDKYRRLTKNELYNLVCNY